MNQVYDKLMLAGELIKDLQHNTLFRPVATKEQNLEAIKKVQQLCAEAEALMKEDTPQL